MTSILTGKPLTQLGVVSVDFEWHAENFSRYYDKLQRRNATLSWGPMRWHLKAVSGKREGNEYVMSFGGAYPFPRKPQLSTRNESRRKKHARRNMRR